MMEKSSMKNRHSADEWLRRARSNIARAKAGKISNDILYEDICFDCQQAVEKSLKGLLVYIDVVFPKTHSITQLIELLESAGIDIPEYVRESVTLTVYAVSTRYPGDQEPVDEDEYKEAFSITQEVYNWVEGKL
jgi:HEPN domain-containing protein